MRKLCRYTYNFLTLHYILHMFVVRLKVNITDNVICYIFYLTSLRAVELRESKLITTDLCSKRESFRLSEGKCNLCLVWVMSLSEYISDCLQNNDYLTADDNPLACQCRWPRLPDREESPVGLSFTCTAILQQRHKARWRYGCIVPNFSKRNCDHVS